MLSILATTWRLDDSTSIVFENCVVSIDLDLNRSFIQSIFQVYSVILESLRNPHKLQLILQYRPLKITLLPWRLKHRLIAALSRWLDLSPLFAFPRRINLGLLQPKQPIHLLPLLLRQVGVLIEPKS